MLIIAAIVSGIVGVAEGEGIVDTIVILVVVIVNAVIGVAQESKAEKSLEALQKLSSHAAKVIRNGKLVVVQSAELVPGDIIGSYKHTFTIYSVNQKKGSAMVFDGGHRFTNKCQQKRKCSILFEYSASTNASLKLLQIIRWTK